MIRFALYFFGIIAAQILVFNQIQFSGFINPAFYLLFVIILPLNTPAWLRLISAFLLGFIIDAFSQSPGLHTASTVLVAYFQPSIVRSFQRTEIEDSKSCSMSNLGFQWFISASILMIFIHQLMFFYLEVFRLTNFFETLMRALLSSFATFIAIMIAQLMIYKKQ